MQTVEHCDVHEAGLADTHVAAITITYIPFQHFLRVPKASSPSHLGDGQTP